MVHAAGSNHEIPDRLTAAKVGQGEVTRTRTLCPYPEVARHGGAGSTETATSFVCNTP
jgi:feruloyl esterase